MELLAVDVTEHTSPIAAAEGMRKRKTATGAAHSRGRAKGNEEDTAPLLENEGFDDNSALAPASKSQAHRHLLAGLTLRHKVVLLSAVAAVAAIIVFLAVTMA